MTDPKPTPEDLLTVARRIKSETADMPIRSIAVGDPKPVHDAAWLREQLLACYAAACPDPAEAATANLKPENALQCVQNLHKFYGNLALRHYELRPALLDFVDAHEQSKGLELAYANAKRVLAHSMGHAEDEKEKLLRDAAPELARLLLALEWSYTDGGYDELCPCCKAFGPGWLTAPGAGQHGPDCALDAALRKAGVR